MPHNPKIPHIYKPLLPIAWLYNVGVWTRNKLFDRGILPVEEFSVPIISVGNLTVGGTGKTPFIEYLIELLSPHTHVAVLSRGYRRKSKGLVIATPLSTPQEIGDEPYQIYSKYRHVTVAVDANRRRGIKALLQQANPPGVILLDDAHQHRYVRPSLSIVLSDFNRPVYADYMMPAGRLREPMSGLRRAHIVVLTKCNHILTTDELHEEAHRLHFDKKMLYAAHIEYAPLRNMATHCEMDIHEIDSKHVILFTGIANPTPIIEYLTPHTASIEALSYPDHHDFTQQELDDLAMKASGENTIIITTEKDAARLSHTQLPASIAEKCYTLIMRTVIQDTASRTPIAQHILQATGIALP